jgi:alkaline phosphatase
MLRRSFEPEENLRRVRPFHAVVAASVLVVTACAKPAAPPPPSTNDWFESGQAAVARARMLAHPGARARNVILFIGDGMGVTTVTAARILEGQLRGEPG